jgi:uncharacterized protein (DUF1810 family)
MCKLATDPFNLSRFIEAQANDYVQALGELRAGHKRTHWIWYVLPQLRGLGTSRLSAFYGIGGLDEARAYLAHPILGPRLVECVLALDALPQLSAESVMGSVDALKLRSCLTLFAAVADDGSPFVQALDHYFSGQRDDGTLRLLASPQR